MTDKPQHTPGPWHMNKGQLIMAGDKIIAGWVCGISDQQPMPPISEGKANAALIAAAPAMLDALESLFEHCAMMHKYWGEGDNTREADAAIEAAKAVIAKAKGN